MKIIYLASTIFSLIFISCSSTYTTKDFSSKEKFYDDFNNFAKDKNVEVQFVNDSSLTIGNGAIIIRDTLYALGFRTDKKFGSIAVSKIKNIDYITSDYKSANLLLKNGSQISVEEINVTNDTLSYTYSKKIITQDAAMPLTKIKKVSYKNRWFSTPAGFLSGGIIGAYIGSKFPSYSYHANMATGKQEVSEQNLNSALYGLGSGVIIGTVTGWLIGYTYTYQFNP
jgi:hypothetical protein